MAMRLRLHSRNWLAPEHPARHFQRTASYWIRMHRSTRRARVRVHSAVCILPQRLPASFCKIVRSCSKTTNCAHFCEPTLKINALTKVEY